jgi:hypothetical protein
MNVTLERDYGLEAVAFVRERLQVDDRWAEPIDRGFRWWAGPLAQSVWAEPLIDDDGIVVSRVHVRTDFLRGFTGTREQNVSLSTWRSYPTPSGPVRHLGDPERIALASCVWVNESNMSWAPQLAAWAAAMQSAEAHSVAPLATELLAATADTSGHPTSGLRSTPDGRFAAIAQRVRLKGRRPSPFAGPEMASVLDLLQRPPCVLATGDERGLTAEFPFHGNTSLLQLLTEERDFAMGNGLHTLLAIPEGENSVEGALEMNGRELHNTIPRAPRSHFLGTWSPSKDALAFSSFLPNAIHVPGLLINLALSMCSRARWVAEVVSGDDWRESFPEAFENKRRYLAEVARRAN